LIDLINTSLNASINIVTMFFFYKNIATMLINVNLCLLVIVKRYDDIIIKKMKKQSMM